MLQKKYRLKKYSAFLATYKNNHIVADNNICLYLGKEKTKTDIITKTAFVVSKKIHKRAVVRNRIKRLMRESFRLILKENNDKNLNKYISAIFVAKSSLVDANFPVVDCSIKNILAKIQ